MLVLLLEVAGEVRQYILCGSVAYTVGRRNCHIHLPQHGSISRHHATLTVLPTPADELLSLAHTPMVLLADVSKHGTTVNGELISSNDAHRPVHIGDTIVFGTVATARLVNLPVVVALSRALPPAVRKHEIQAACRLGALCGDEPIPRDHLVDAGVSPFATVFVSDTLSRDAASARAMLEGYTFVRPGYLSTLLGAAREAPGTELSALPSPHAFDVAVDPAFAHCQYVRPATCVFAPGEYAHAPVPSRGIFRSRHFVFVTCGGGDAADEELLALGPVVEAGEGSVTVRSLDDLARWLNEELPASDPAADVESDAELHLLPLRGLIPDRFTHGLNTSFVVPPPVMSAFEDQLAARLEASHSAMALTDPVAAHLRPLSRLYRSRYAILSSDAILNAVASFDPAMHLLAAGSQGVVRLQEGEVAVGSSDEDVDSNATAEGIEPFRITASHPQPVDPHGLPPAPSAAATAPTDSSYGSAARRSGGTAYDASLVNVPSDGIAKSNHRDLDLYDDWLAFRRTDSAKTRARAESGSRRSPVPSVNASRALAAVQNGSSSARRRRSASPSATPKRKAIPDFRTEFESQFPVLQRRVLRVADNAVDSGRLSRSEASMLEATHQRIVNYLDWVRIDDERRQVVTPLHERTAAHTLLTCIESTMASCAVSP